MTKSFPEWMLNNRSSYDSELRELQERLAGTERMLHEKEQAYATLQEELQAQRRSKPEQESVRETSREAEHVKHGGYDIERSQYESYIFLCRRLGIPVNGEKDPVIRVEDGVIVGLFFPDPIHLRSASLLTEFPDLRSLSFSVDGENPGGNLSALAELQQLDHLTVYNPHYDQYDLSRRGQSFYFGEDYEFSTRVRDFLVSHLYSWAVDRKGWGLASLSGLARLKHLEVKHPVRNLGPVTKLTNLESLSLRSWSSDIRPLAGLSKLRCLKIVCTRINTLRPLAHLRELRQLEVECEEIIDLDSLAELSKLEDVSLNGWQDDLSPFHNHPRLRRLCVSSGGYEKFQKVRPEVEIV